MLRWLTRQGFHRGLLGGSRGWFYVGSFAIVVRALRAVLSEKPVVYQHELKRGEAIQIRAIRPER